MIRSFDAWEPVLRHTLASPDKNRSGDVTTAVEALATEGDMEVGVWEHSVGVGARRHHQSSSSSHGQRRAPPRLAGGGVEAQRGAGAAVQVRAAAEAHEVGHGNEVRRGLEVEAYAASNRNS